MQKEVTIKTIIATPGAPERPPAWSLWAISTATTTANPGNAPATITAVTIINAAAATGIMTVHLIKTVADTTKVVIMAVVAAAINRRYCGIAFAGGSGRPPHFVTRSFCDVRSEPGC
jgi:hypothetical protein